MIFEPHYLGTPEATIVYYTIGNPDNPPLLFINGGPGDDHHYLRDVAQAYVDDFYCVLYDQRGCGKSTVSSYNNTVINIETFMADIDRIRRYLRVEQLVLWGHSWGATLALYYGAFYPDKVQSMVLVGMGPINDEYTEVARANYNKPLSADEREARADLRNARNLALADEDWETLASVMIEMVTQYTVKSWFYGTEARETFAKDYAANYSYNAQIAPLLLPTVKAIDIVSAVRGKTFPVQIVYGYQDFEPITQAYLLRDILPVSEVCFINEAGHVIWYEQPTAFYKATLTFLKQHMHNVPDELPEDEPDHRRRGVD